MLAANLRAAITSLPPVFPELESVLHISAGDLALLAAVPVLCFGIFSGSAAPLSRRFGEERVLGAALVLLALGLALRGASPQSLLFPGTIVAGAAIALLNVLLPSLVKRRMPDRAGLVIGLYLLMLSAGAIVASLLAVPVFNSVAGSAVPPAGRGARLTLAMWAVPALVAAAIWGCRSCATARCPGAVPKAGGPPGPARWRCQPVRSGLAWQVMLFMGLQSLSYYATLSWFPTMFRDRGVSAVHAGDLLALMNLGNAVTALLVPVLAQRAADQRWLAAAAMAAIAAGLAGAGFGPYGLAAGFMVLLGLGQGASLGLGIFYTMARWHLDPVTAASLSGFAQGAGYLIASSGPLTIGFLHDESGGWTLPGAVLLGIAVLQLITGWLAGRDRTAAGRGWCPRS